MNTYDMIFGIVVKHHFLNAKRIRRGVRREMRRGREGVCEGRCGDGATGIEKMGAKRVRRGCEGGCQGGCEGGWEMKDLLLTPFAYPFSPSSHFWKCEVSLMSKSQK